MISRRRLRSLIDGALDRSVVGYSRIGHRVRRAWDWEEPERMDGKVVLVTGATSGVGRAAAEGFARLGAAVWILARDRARGESAREAIVARTGNRDVEVLLCDLSDLRAVRRAAQALRAHAPRLDVLVNNAGVLPAERALSRDGIELTLATNVIGPFLLTSLLTGLLAQSAPSRIVNVSSGGMYTQRLHVDDLEMAGESFDGVTAYARSKRIEVVLTELWAERLRDRGVVVHSMHPGWVDTAGLEASLPRFHRLAGPLLRTPEQGADTIVWLGAAAEAAALSGGFWHDRRRRPTHRLPWTRESAQERQLLWRECERLSGLTHRSSPASAGAQARGETAAPGAGEDPAAEDDATAREQTPRNGHPCP